MFLSIITRCNRRPNGLYRNIESVATQTITDYEQVFLWDGQDRGVPWAGAQLGIQGRRVRGQYVMVLDDDDVLAEPDAIESIREAADQLPDMIVWRTDHGPELGVLPSDDVWLRSPRQGRIGMSCWAVHHEIWHRFLHAWQERYDADYRWLDAVWDHTRDRVWVDRVLTACPDGRSIGEPEYSR